MSAYDIFYGPVESSQPVAQTSKETLSSFVERSGRSRSKQDNLRAAVAGLRMWHNENSENSWWQALKISEIVFASKEKEGRSFSQRTCPEQGSSTNPEQTNWGPLWALRQAYLFLGEEATEEDLVETLADLQLFAKDQGLDWQKSLDKK